MKQALKRPLIIAPPKDRFSVALLSTVNQIVDQANVDVTTGSVLASADTITPLAKRQHVSGTAAIENIIVPPTFTGGELIFIPDGNWTTVTGGTIGKASNAVIGVPLYLTYDGAKFWPSY